MKQFILISVLLLCLCHINCFERKSYLKCGEFLKIGQFIESTNGYYFVLQNDCNAVIYRSKHFVPRNSLWATNSKIDNCNNAVLINQNDGNVVIYNNYGSSNQNAIYATNTNNDSSCYNLVMQDDGNLVLYDLLNRAIWASGTEA